MDPDLVDLALALAECRLDTGARGWFDMPWRDSWNAVALAADLAHAATIDTTPDDAEAISFVRCAAVARAADTETYHRADELLRLCAGNALVSAALRCLQLTMSRSDGGGEVPSVVLRIAYERACIAGTHESLVITHRCHDALGTTVERQGDAFDKIRRAFSIAWDRGMFRTIYGLPHVDDRKAKA